MNSDKPENTTSDVEVDDALEEIAESLLKSVPDDPRFQSGAAQQQDTADDLKFIEMSGLAAPEDISAAPPTAAEIPYEFLQEDIPPNATTKEEPAAQHPPTQKEPEPQAREPEAQQPASHVILESPEERAPVSDAPAVLDLPATDGDESREKGEETLLQELLQESSPAFVDSHKDVESYKKKPESESQGEVLIGGEKLSPGMMTDEDWAPLSPSSGLNEAEELVGALQAQITASDETHLDHASETSPPEEIEPQPLPAYTPTEDTRPAAATTEKEPQSSKEVQKKKSSHHKRRNRFRRRVVRLVAAACFLLVILGAGFYARHWFQRFTARPEVLCALAERYAEKGDFPAAIAAYEDFIHRYPEHPDRGSAQFSVAFLRQAQAEKTGTTSENVYKKSIEAFETFLRENPAHPKAARARTMIGLLSFRIGDYGKAIEILKDPELRLKDPVASLSILRTLARAYALSGDMAAAQATFLQAAKLETNPSPDLDYDELGNLYQNLSETTPVPENRLRYQQMALMYWEEAASFAGTSPTTRNALQHKIDILREKLKAPENATNAEAENTQENTQKDIVQPSEEAPKDGQGAVESRGNDDGMSARSSDEPTPSSPVARQGEETP
ncbi:MAG TPA: tetratricopeptide repeat protein [Candidatus Hydrogenedentes bacterium]|nr:tetratricopeptide repeat protein [Candidatus Hydrogenedentota bacterium]HOL77767.1 tetratricopeptide repeat protein [Candidatus Hydrogenedentota bacterium]HPO86419.1 tetratricopeptide repeat protein [Candidatus Hydrogenedentota bacterium]